MIFILEGNDFLKQEFLQDHLDKKFFKVPEKARQASIVKNPQDIGQITTVSFMSAIYRCGRVIIWDYAEFKKLEKFNPYIIPKDIDIFIIATDKVDKRLKIIQALISFRAEIKTFKDLYPNQVENWINQRKKAMKLQIQPDAVKMLAILYGTNLAELQKCLQALLATSGIITKMDVQKIAIPVNEFSIFELQDEILFHRPMKSLYILKQMLKFGEQPISMIRYFVGLFDRLNTIKLGDSQLIEELKLHPFILKKLNDFVISTESCLFATEMLKRAEISILCGCSPEFVIQKTILNLCRIREDNHVL
jgi:DNA polymerase III subunit delta